MKTLLLFSVVFCLFVFGLLFFFVFFLMLKCILALLLALVVSIRCGAAVVQVVQRIGDQS